MLGGMNNTKKQCLGISYPWQGYWFGFILGVIAEASGVALGMTLVNYT